MIKSFKIYFGFLLLGIFSFSIPISNTQADEIKIPDRCGLLASEQLNIDELKECLRFYKEAYDASHPEEAENQKRFENGEEIAGYEPQMMKNNQNIRGYEPQMHPASYEPQMKSNNQNIRGYEPQMYKGYNYH